VLAAAAWSAAPELAFLLPAPTLPVLMSVDPLPASFLDLRRHIYKKEIYT
jgi:hypothetical protein